jgi:NAD(P)-dependent dehydrogenase (short-subunit alcohol dehydrogenase family)
MSRTVVVTGCSSGSGHQVSAQLARRGDRVYATMRGVAEKNPAAARELQALAAAEKLDLRIVEMDVTSTSSIDAAAARVLKESGAPDVIINNAGQMFVGLAEAFTAEEFSRQLEVNVVGIHRVTRAFLPSMRARGRGLIINISSAAGRVAVPFHALYHASQWAVEGYSLAQRRELASSGIDVVVVEPGPFTTALFPTMRQPTDSEGRAASYPAAAHQAFKRMGVAFEGLFKDPALPTDPTLVVNRMIELTEMKPGTRPFRSVVGIDFGVRDLNASAEPHEAALLDSMALTSFATIAPTKTV